MELRSEFVRLLRQQVDSKRFELWIDGQIEFEIRDKTVRVITGDEFSLARAQRQFGADFQRTASMLPGRPKIDYVIGEVKPVCSESPALLVSEGSDQVQMRRSEASMVSVVSKKTKQVENKYQPYEFVFCEQNQLVRSTVEEICRSPGQISPVLFYGPTGCGKTVLTDSLRRRCRKSGIAKRTVWMSAEQFTSAYLGALNGQGLPMFRRHYRDLELLIIDDIQFFRGKKATTAEFQHTVDSLLAAGQQIVLTADRPPMEMEFLSNELVTRLSAGLVCPVRYADERARQMIAQQFCRRRGYEFSESVIEVIADSFPQDARQMSGALNRLQMAVSSEEQAELQPGDALELIADLRQTRTLHWSMKQIENVVCDIAGVTKNEIRSTSRAKRICTARMLAMWLSRQYTRSALSEIGGHFGGRSHSTVIAATKKVDQLIENNEKIEVNRSQLRIRDLVERVNRDISRTA